MTKTSSSAAAGTKGLCGFQVLLVEPDKKSLQHHAYVLLLNSYRVKSTMKVSEALSMIINGGTFDCVLVDAENHDMDLVDFLHTIWSHQPQSCIIVMTSNESHLQIGRETLANDTIWFLRKPCGGSSICNMLQHVCRKLAFRELASTRKSLENHERNVIQRVDTMHPSTIFNITMINNNTSSSSGARQGLNINSQKYGVAYVDISSDDDEDARHKNICIGSSGNKYRGKQPMELKREHEPRSKGSMNRQKRKEISTRIAWTPALHAKFLQALNTLGKEGAYPKAILKQMNVPGLTRAQVASHLQRIQERENHNMTKHRVVGRTRKGINLQADGYAYKRSRLSTSSDNNEWRLNCSSLQIPLNYNSIGISFVALDNIRSRLQEGPPLPLPQQTTTTVNNSALQQSIEHHSGDQFQPLIGESCSSTAFGLADQSNKHSFGDRFEALTRETSMSSKHVLIENSHNATVESQYKLGTNVDIFSNGLDNDNFMGAGGIAVSEGLATFDRFGIPIGPCVTVGSGAHSSGSSIVPFDGSEGRIIDNDWYMKLIHHEHEDSAFSIKDLLQQMAP